MSIRLKMATYISFFFKWSGDRRIEQIGLVVEPLPLHATLLRISAGQVTDMSSLVNKIMIKLAV